MVLDKLVIGFPLGVWLFCAAIALGSYLTHVDIGFIPGFITWGVFLGGIVYCILIAIG